MSSKPARAPRTMLEHLIQQRDRTYEELAAEFSQLDEHAAISARHPGRLARGERELAGTTPATRRALQALFGLPADELLRPWSPQLAPTIRTCPDGPLVMPSTGDERSILAMAAQRARRFTLTASEGTTPDIIDQLHADVQRLALAYPQRPVTELLGDLAETQDTLFTLIERRQGVTQARQLHFLAAVTGGLLAKASHDLADPHSAMLQARTAFFCAEQADHNGLRAWLRGLQSLVAYWAGRYAEALRYAEQGIQYADHASGTAAVWLPVSAARAYAALGDAPSTLSEIRRAEQAWDQVQPDELDELGGICTFNRPRTLYYAADALAWLPASATEDQEATAAQEYAAKAVDAYADPTNATWAFGDQAGAHTDLTIARIAGRDLDGAAEALAPVLDLPPEKRIHGVTSSVRRVHQALIRAGLAADAAELIDAIEDFTRHPLNALPR